jgi:hypothetical protein
VSGRLPRFEGIENGLEGVNGHHVLKGPEGCPALRGLRLTPTPSLIPSGVRKVAPLEGIETNLAEDIPRATRSVRKVARFEGLRLRPLTIFNNTSTVRKVARFEGLRLHVLSVEAGHLARPEGCPFEGIETSLGYLGLGNRVIRSGRLPRFEGIET